MIKEFEINEILKAMVDISENNRKIAKRKIKDILEAIEIISKVEKKDDVFTVNNQVKSTKSDILVLKEMIE